MIARINRLLRRWKWQVWLLIVLSACVIAITIYFPSGFNDCSREFLIFGVFFPIFFLSVLMLIARTKLIRSVGAGRTSIDKGLGKVKQRVLVVENDLLLGAGIENLLLRESNLDVIGISCWDEEEMIRKIRYLQPATVILDEASFLTHSIRLLARLMQDHELKLVIVNADNNMIQVYHKQNILLMQSSDLIKVLLEK